MLNLVWIKGAGDLASGVAFRLRMAGYPVLMTELSQPLCVRRAVSFAEAVRSGRQTVEGVTAVLLEPDSAQVRTALARGEIALLVDPDGAHARALLPPMLVDGIMAKRNTGTRITDAPVVVGLGPGFTAGADCHAVVETGRGHFLGRALYQGAAAPDTGEPGEVAGVGAARVVRAPAEGLFEGLLEIGARVVANDVLGAVAGVPVRAAVGGVLRGLIRSGVPVTPGMKVGDVDPTGEVVRCHTISDKALSVAGGVLEAVLRLSGRT